MKKYQLWLERKTYSQHLSNLMRIKMSSTDRKNAFKLPLPPEKVRGRSHNASLIKLNQSLAPQDLSYIITARELQKHKLRLVRSNEIVRQNEEMAKRINKTKPFVSNTRPIDYTNYKLKRQMQRSNEQHSSQLKLKNYQQFMKLRQQKAAPNHRYQLTLNILSLDFKITPGQSTEVAVEILAPKSIAKSEYIPPQQIEKHTFQFTFENQLPDNFIVQIHTYKGLEHNILGNYDVARPQEDVSVVGEWQAVGLHGKLEGRIIYKKLTPKFWTLKQFKV